MRPPLPELKDKKWARNAVDQFILAKLEATGLRPSPEADRVTMIRRLALDLTGLPPTPEEVDAFVNDHQLSVVDLVKIDTESTEPQVVRGMSQTLARHRPHLIVEVLGHTRTEDELTNLLRPHGYRFFHLRPDGPTLQSSIRPQPPWDNYLITTLAEEDVSSLWSAAARWPNHNPISSPL